jgi:hypothetical protein
MNKYTEEFIKKAKEFHCIDDETDNVKFIYSESLNIILPSQSEPVEITCVKHNHTFNVVPRWHLKWVTGGCIKCRTDMTMIQKIKKSKEQWEKDKLITHLFDDGTPKYDYSKFIFINKRTPGNIICNTCKKENRPYEFKQSPYHHIDRKQNCNNCSNVESGLKQSRPLVEYIKLCKIKHEDQYSYDKINETYTSGKSIIEIFCKKCEEYFIQRANQHISGSGCIVCGYAKSALSKQSNTQYFIDKASKIGKNIETCDYSDTVYISSKEKLNIKCIPCNLIYKITPNSHLRGKGCPSCNHHTSKSAREWLHYIQLSNDILLQTFDSIEGEYKIPKTKYKVDGYDPQTKTIYEFHGDFWHGNPNKYPPEFINPIIKKPMNELYNMTCKKKEICISLGYKYVEMWESEWILLKSKQD